LSRFRKTVSVGAEVTSGGKLFQRQLPATGNTQSPTVDSMLRWFTSCEDDRQLETAAVRLHPYFLFV